MPWIVNLTVINQTTDTIEIMVDSGPLEVVDAQILGGVSFLHLKAPDATSLAHYINTNGIPGMDPGTDVAASVSLESDITTDGAKIIVYRDVEDTEFDPPETPFRTTLLDSNNSNSPWGIRLTSIDKKNAFKIYPDEIVRIELQDYDEEQFKKLSSETTSGEIVKRYLVTYSLTLASLVERINAMGEFFAVIVSGEADAEVGAPGQIISGTLVDISETELVEGEHYDPDHVPAQVSTPLEPLPASEFPNANSPIDFPPGSLGGEAYDFIGNLVT
jgi:hypothetical protein